MTEERHNVVTGALDCWCDPKYLKPCVECDTGCWKCNEGSIHLTREEAEQEVNAIVIVHASDVAAPTEAK